MAANPTLTAAWRTGRLTPRSLRNLAARQAASTTSKQITTIAK